MKQITLQELTAMRRKCQLSVLGMIAILAAALLCISLCRPMMFVLAGLAVLYHIFLDRRLEKKYMDAVSLANLQRTVCKTLGTDTVRKDGGDFTIEQIRAADLLPLSDKKGASAVFCTIAGQMDGMPTVACDVSLCQSYNTEKHEKLDFSTGCWISMELPVNTESDWRLIDHKAVKPAARAAWLHGSSKMQELSMDDADAERFSLYSSNEETRPDKKVMTQIRLLADYTPGAMAVSLQGSHLTVFLVNRVLARNVALNAPPTEKGLDFDPMPELSYVKRLANVIAGQSAAAEK